MKKTIILILTLLISVVSCKNPFQNDDKTKKKVDSLGVDKTIKTAKISDSLKIKLAKLSLNKLISLYEKTTHLESGSNKFLLLAISNAIGDKHEILGSTYATLTENFWGKNVLPLTKTMSKNEVVSMIGTAKTDQYIQFDFSDKKDTLFNTSIVRVHDFNKYISCFPALIFMKMKQDPQFNKLEITKGQKIFNTTNHKGLYYMTLLKYTDKSSKIQFFDIVDDPTIDYKNFNPSVH